MPLPKVTCTLEIPEPFRWDESFQVFYTNLDEEHKGLFQGVFALTDKTKNIDQSLSTLKTRVLDHFADEENMMVKVGYAGFAAHKKAHDDFVAALNPLSGTDVNDHVLTFAKEWLVNHIKTVDFQYKGSL